MKRILSCFLAIIVLLLMVSCSKGPENISSGEKTSDITDGSTVIGKSYYEDDKHIKDEYYNPDGSVEYICEYNDDDTIGKRTDFYYNGEGKVSKKIVATYSGENKLSEQVFDYDDEENIVSETKTKFTYNGDGSVITLVEKDGKTISEKSVDKDGAIIYQKTYTETGAMKNYYENGYITKYETFDSEDVLVSYTNNIFNENNKIIKSKTFKADGHIMLISDYEYVEEKLTRVLMYLNGDQLWRINEYDENGNVTTYDEYGNIVE